MALVTPKRPNYASLYVVPRFSGQVLSSATGFVATRPDSPLGWLVTNWHVVTGRVPESGQPLDKKTGGVPDELQVLYHRKDEPGAWIEVRHDLYDPNGDPFWLEHPTHGRKVDVVAIPVLTTLPGGEEIEFYGGHDPWREDTLATLNGELPVDIAAP